MHKSLRTKLKLNNKHADPDGSTSGLLARFDTIGF
jgi:hypothetical protein